LIRPRESTHTYYIPLEEFKRKFKLKGKISYINYADPSNVVYAANTLSLDMSGSDTRSKNEINRKEITVTTKTKDTE